MNDNIKIYCIFFDTMPWMNELIQLADYNSMQKLSQISGCFTMTALFEMFTGKMPSDIMKKGMGHRSLEKYRNRISKKIYVPWNSQYVTSKLAKNRWKIHVHNFPPNGYIHGDIHTDSYDGGYENRYNKIMAQRKPSYSGKMMDRILCDSNRKSHEWHKREIDFIKSMPKQKYSCNTFHFIEYEHFHSFESFTKRQKREQKDKVKQRITNRTINLLKTWDFNEENAIFWVFADHGFPEKIKSIPISNDYLTWVLFKDNVSISIRSKSNMISIRDFSPTIFKKLKYKYKSTSESMPICEIEDKDRVYYVEDGRSKFNMRDSTTALSCMVIDWKNNRPINILQVCYFKINDKYYYNLNEIDKNGFFIRSNKLMKKDKKYSKTIYYLKKKLRKRFKWVK